MEIERLDFDKYLPAYIQKDIVALIEGVKNNVTYVDCLWCELYGSINSAYYDNEISYEDAATLRLHYLGLEDENGKII